MLCHEKGFLSSGGETKAEVPSATIGSVEFLVTLLPKRCRCFGWESHWETMAYVNCFSVNVMCVYK